MRRKVRKGLMSAIPLELECLMRRKVRKGLMSMIPLELQCLMRPKVRKGLMSMIPKELEWQESLGHWLKMAAVARRKEHLWKD
jgi:hypothetical protein